MCKYYQPAMKALSAEHREMYVPLRERYVEIEGQLKEAKAEAFDALNRIYESEAERQYRVAQAVERVRGLEGQLQQVRSEIQRVLDYLCGVYGLPFRCDVEIEDEPSEEYPHGWIKERER